MQKKTQTKIFFAIFYFLINLVVKLFELGRLSAPGEGGFYNFRKEKNTKPIIFRACDIKFSSPKFFNSGSPNLLKVLIMDV